MNDKKSHKNKQFQKNICLFTLFVILLPSFSIFGFASIQNSSNPPANIKNIKETKLEEFKIEKELLHDLDLIIVDQSIQMNYGTVSSSYEDSRIIYYKLGLLFSIILIEIGVILKKRDGKSQKERENYAENSMHSHCSDFNQEIIVFDYIQEYLQNNRKLEVEKIITYLNSRFAKSGINLSNMGIEVIIKSLLDKKLIVEGSKLTRGNILDNPNRKNIYEYIKEMPGVHLMKIVRKLNMNNFLVRWHLDMLLKFNYIMSENISNHEIYYEISINLEEARFNHLLMKEKCSNIIKYLENNDKGSTKYQLGKELGMHYNTISKYLTELNKHDLVFKKDSEKRVLYFLNDNK